LSKGDKVTLVLSSGQTLSGTIKIYNGNDVVIQEDWQSPKDGGFPFLTKDFVVPDSTNSGNIKIEVITNEFVSTSFQSQYRIAKKIDSGNKDLTYQWQPVKKDGITPEQTLNKADYSDGFTYRWDGLDKITQDGKQIVYRVVEKGVDETKYSVSYQPSSEISSNRTVKITNKDKSASSSVKKAIYPGLVTSVNDVWGLATDSEHKYITSITEDDLKNWPTRTIDDKEYYIFKWKLDFGEGVDVVKFKDEISDGINPYIDDYQKLNYGANNARFDFVVSNGNVTYGIASGSSNGWKDVVNGTAWSDANKNDYDGSFEFDSSKAAHDTERFQNIKWITYCTAVPKETIDEAMAENGKYEVINNIRLNDEKDFAPAKLTIKKEAEKDPSEKLIEKGFRKDNNFVSSAIYTLKVNKEGKNLTNGDMIDISDLFEPLMYNDEPYNNQFDINLGSFDIWEIDSNGNRKLDSSEYIYLFDSGETETKTDYPVGGLSIINGSQWTDSQIMFESRFDIPKDLEFTYNISGGTPGASVNCNAATQYNSTVSVTCPATYDSDGKATIVIKTNDNSMTNQDMWFTISNCPNPQVTVSAGTVETKKENRLQISVPDGMPLEIEYRYDFTVNENTPNRKGIDDKDVAVGQPLDKLASRPTIKMKNKASFQTSNGEESDEHTENQFKISDSSAEIALPEYPIIKKIDVGNHSIKLSADFYLAKFDKNAKKWEYVTNVKPQIDEKSKVEINNLTFGANETTDGKVPADAKEFTVPDSGFYVSLTKGELYKLIETKEPEGYVDLGYKDGSLVNGKYPYVYYFMYDSVPDNTLIENINSVAGENKVSRTDITRLADNSTLKVPNSNKFDLVAEKEWGVIPLNSEAVSVELELVWSYKKSSNIPEVTYPLSELGRTDSIKTIDGKDDGQTQWNDLPNGKDGRPIYYYVVEKSYTVKENGTDKKYTLSDDGTYKNGSETGDFKPIYTGNGLNTGKSDGTAGKVEIKNASKLVVKKIWQNADGTEITGTYPLSEIKFNLYGIKADKTEVQLVTDGVIKESENWQKVIDNNDLSSYEKFRVEEVIVTDTEKEVMANYTISDTYNVIDGTGEIILTNKIKFHNQSRKTINQPHKQAI
ncbi:MAG: Cna B-type domain-containing protein, partial [Ruminococcus sp.]|nr:Cna B-type domain-containing protein [Ruminococcus sp.]